MSTYSLTLRQRKGRRLSISEVDNNWLYLKELAELGGTSSANILIVGVMIYYKFRPQTPKESKED